jgi:ribonuclease P protein component
MPGQFTLGKDERLKSRKLIEELFSEGKNFALSPFRIYYKISPQSGNVKRAALKIGAGVSTKNFKKAVDRNRIKRLIREAWRLQKNVLQEKLNGKGWTMNVFIIYTSKELTSFPVVSEKLRLILDRLVKQVDENSFKNT